MEHHPPGFMCSARSARVREARLGILALGLVILALGQIGALFLRSHPEPIPVTPDQLFPTSVRSIDSSEPMLEMRGCVVLVICKTSCVHCAERASERGSDGANSQVDVLWAIVGSREEATRFAAEYSFGPHELGYIEPSFVGSSLFRRRYLSIPGTPFQVIINAQHGVSSVRLGIEIPAPADMESLCD